MRINKLKFFCCLSLSILGLKPLYAQEQEKSVTVIFAKPVEKKKASTIKNNILKLSPTGVFVGQMPIIYERKLNKHLSIQGGFGITLQNYVRTIFQGNSSAEINYTNLPWENLQSTTYYSDKADRIYLFDKRKAETGFMFTIQPKIYFDSDALDEGFVGIAFSSINYKFSYPKAQIVSGNGSYSLKFNGANQQESETITDFMIHVGKQWIKDRIVVETSTAIGLRRVTGTKYVADVDDNTGKLFDGLANYNQTLFNWEYALRIGYNF